MGKRNRERRKQKQRAGRSSTTTRAGGATGGRPDWSRTAPTSPAEAFALLVDAQLGTSSERVGRLLEGLLTQWSDAAATPSVPAAVADALATGMATAWSRGWQPAELVHALARKESAQQRRLLVDAIAADAEAWRHHPEADPTWLAHLDDVGATRWWPEGAAHLDAWTARERLDRVNALLACADLVGTLWRVPKLHSVSDPPSAWGRVGARSSVPRRTASAIDERILKRVRALLAKAESTDFDAEADSLTAKAQELMARYSIDHAMVGAGRAGSGRGGDDPTARRVLLHDPYAKGKSLLLARVASASRCRAINSPDFGFSTVFGYPIDLEVVEILYTSLVTQCSASMQAASRKVANPRSFRESFTVAFAARIGERLSESASATIEESRRDHGDALLPVLASRDADVESAMEQAFPDRVSRNFRAADHRGWAAGTAAAEVATISYASGITA